MLFLRRYLARNGMTNKAACARFRKKGKPKIIQMEKHAGTRLAQTSEQFFDQWRIFINAYPNTA